MTKVLAIGAHPDDIELGCSATLLKHKKNGDKVYLLVLTKGEASGNPETREKECRISGELMGVEEIFLGGIKDTEIDDGTKTIRVIENIIDQIKPDIIYTHSYKDTHQDHRNTGYATLSAGRRCKKILFYESPTTFKEFSPQIYVDIKDEFEKKRRIVLIFSTQLNKSWWGMGNRAASAIEGLALYRGYQGGLEMAEAFEVARFVINSNEMILWHS